MPAHEEPPAASGPRGRRPPPRIVIEHVTPRVDEGRFPARGVVGGAVRVEADVFADGHDRLVCTLAHQVPGSRQWQDVPMELVVNDRWQAAFDTLGPGTHRYRVLAWIDHFATLVEGIHRKREVGHDVASDLLVGAALLEEAAERVSQSGAATLHAAASSLRDGDADPLVHDQGALAALVRASLRRGEATASATYEVDVERERAGFSAWYELFPRSWATEPGRHGRLRDVAARIGYVAEMGFDVLYLPPIHPIGRTNRKGPDNDPVGREGDVGSPWAIGAAEGGHDTIHPDLGTEDDLTHLVETAGHEGMEVALDLAFQCAPDHPWVSEHPEWFRHRPDGTIQYAENPPKKYEDIYPFDFENEHWLALWTALRDVVLHWVDLGIRIFRVDNPHTKPFAFWEWLIAEVRAAHPDVIFLSEAFTRPKVMHRLAKIGFSQSYTYFTWRVSKQELTDYYTELASDPGVHYFRPNAWPNTPDILPFHLQGAPHETFALRLVLAATLTPNYGIYGPVFELGENEPLHEGKEEYRHAEKYEIREWELDDPTSLRELITGVNAARHAHPAFRELASLRFHTIDNDALLCFTKQSQEGRTILVVVNLDPAWPQSGWTDLDLPALGFDWDAELAVEDLLTGDRYEWTGPRNFVLLDPGERPAHVFDVTPGGP